MKIINIDLATGIKTTVDATSEEIAEANELKNINEQKKQEIENENTTKTNLKTSAKAKLIAGEPLTEAEANTIVL